MGRRSWRVIRRTAVSFYDDQMTHHAAAMTYYTLMSLFPTLLLGLSLLGLLGQYPQTYDAIISHVRDVVPQPALGALDSSLRETLRHKGTAVGGLTVGLVVALYGSTGALEAARRALNVVFEIKRGRSFLRRKLIDIGSSLVLGVLAIAVLTLMFVGGGLAERLFDVLGVGSTGRALWGASRWPLAVLVAVFVFSCIYYITPDVRHRSFRWVTPGAFVAVAAWLGASLLFSLYLSNFVNVSAVYGTFAAAIVLIVWIWLTNVALLFGAELDAEIERERELAAGVPLAQTLDLPARRG